MNNTLIISFCKIIPSSVFFHLHSFKQPHKSSLFFRNHLKFHYRWKALQDFQTAQCHIRILFVFMAAKKL